MRNRLLLRPLRRPGHARGVAAGHLVAALHQPGRLPGARGRVHGHRPDADAGQGVGDRAVRHGRQADPDRLGAAWACSCSPGSPGVLAQRRFAFGAALLVVLVAVAGRRGPDPAHRRRPRPRAEPGRRRRRRRRALVARPPRRRRHAGLRGTGAPGAPGDRRARRQPRAVSSSPPAALAAAAAAHGRRRPLDHGVPHPPRGHRPARRRRPGARRCPPAWRSSVPGISPFRTPNDDFYRVDTRLTLPDRRRRRLVADHRRRRRPGGHASRSTTCSRCDLIERDITLTCVSNDVGGPYVGGARWLGVPLTDLLDRAGVGTTGPTRSSPPTSTA